MADLDDDNLFLVKSPNDHRSFKRCALEIRGLSCGTKFDLHSSSSSHSQ
jgi:hypothetical protein